MPLYIGINRKLFVTAAVLLIVVGAGAISREITKGSVGVAIVIVIVFSGPCFYYVRGLVRRGSAIVIGPEELGGFRVGRTIPWESVSDIYVTQRQGIFGVHHRLVVTVRRDDLPPVNDSLGLLTQRVTTETIEFSIDQLAVPWNKIVDLLQGRLGRGVSTKKETFLSAVRTKDSESR